MSQAAWLRLYGGPELVCPDKALVFTPIQASLIALSYLEAPGTLTRDRITWLMWGEGEEAKTRHRIRQLLYKINSNGAEVLTRQGEAVVPLLPSDWTELPPGMGEPLARLTSAPTAEFEHWLDRAVVRLADSRRTRLARRLDSERRQSTWQAAFDTAATLFRVDPTPETWLATLVGTAIRARRTAECRAVLVGVLQAGGINKAAFEQAEAKLEAVPSLASHIESRERPSFVGREAERQTLESEVASGSGLRIGAVIAEAGMGRTMMLDEVTLFAASRGHRVVAEQFDATCSAVPMAGIKRVVRRLLSSAAPVRVPEPWDRVLQFGRGEIATLDPPSTRRRLVEAVRVAFESASIEDPTTIVLDDLQFIDLASLSVIEEVVTTWKYGDCYVLVSILADPDRHLDPRMEAFLSDVRARRLLLDPLPEATSRRLLRDTAALSETSTTEIVSVARGRPAILVDLAQYWLRETTVRDQKNPGSLVAYSRRRVDQLEGGQRQVLALLVAAPGQSSEQIRTTVNRPSWVVLDTLDRLVGLGLVEPRAGTYGFRHSLFRSAVGEVLGETRLREAHLQMGRHLARNGKDPAKVANHFRLAGLKKEAADWALEAARESKRDGALAEALGFYETALESEENQQAEVLAEAGEACLMLCRHKPGVDLLLRAEASAGPEPRIDWSVKRLDAQSEAGLVPHQRIVAELEELAARATRRRQWEASLLATETAIRVLEREGDWSSIRKQLAVASLSQGRGDLRSRIRRQMILSLGMIYGDVPGASQAGRLAFELASSGSVPDELRVRAAHRLFVVLLSEGTVESRLGTACIEALQAWGSATGDLKLRYTTLANRAVWYLETDALEQAGELLDEAAKIVAGSPESNESQNLATNRGDLALRQGRPDRALRYFELAQGLIQPGTRGFLVNVVAAGIGLAKLRLGQFHAAERLSRELTSHGHYYFDPSLMVRLRVELLRRRRQVVKAIAHLDQERRRIRDSFVPQYLSLTLWQAQLERRENVGAPSDRFEEVIGRSTELGISRLARRAQAVWRAEAD